MFHKYKLESEVMYRIFYSAMNLASNQFENSITQKGHDINYFHVDLSCYPLSKNSMQTATNEAFSVNYCHHIIL